uniref:Uncharacterized protein n=1 Tax=Heterorhabditis bacteriophora TaxID=37862 RepID=A0A1I7X6E4_HETBA
MAFTDVIMFRMVDINILAKQVPKRRIAYVIMAIHYVTSYGTQITKRSFNYYRVVLSPDFH